MKNNQLVSVWKTAKKGNGLITGYLETFKTANGATVSLPGISRWIDGPVFDESKAYLIEG